jgi:phosphoribosylanthranilate isomerase
MTWVKLCGMTRRIDVEAAVDAGADAVGFVVYPGSPRHVDAAAVAGLAEGIDAERFLVTVDADPEWLTATAADVGVDGVQPHGTHAEAAARAALEAGLRVLFPVAVGNDIPDLSVVPAGARPLLDTAAGILRGGSGRSFDWSLASGLGGGFVLAGGLTPGVVADAVRRTGAWGVDVASGVEAAPGVKDHVLMRRFVTEARA